MHSEPLLFVEHDDDLELSDKAHCGTCVTEVTDAPHCGGCMVDPQAEASDKAHCGTCF